MTKPVNGCPYKASNNGQCTHKTTPEFLKQKRYCEYNKPSNCEMFRDWSENKEKSNPTPINPPKTDIKERR